MTQETGMETNVWTIRLMDELDPSDGRRKAVKVSLKNSGPGTLQIVDASGAVMTINVGDTLTLCPSVDS